MSIRLTKEALKEVFSSGEGRFRQLHRVNQLLTLYLQKRQEAISWGGFSHAGEDHWDGKSLLLAPLPSDEYSRTRHYDPAGWGGAYGHYDDRDYDEVYVPSTWGLTVGAYSRFLAPQILSSPIEIRGTGYACIRLSSWTDLAPGIAEIWGIDLELRRYSETTLVDKPFTKHWDLDPDWENTSLTEVKRSLFLELPNLDFELTTDLRLALLIMPRCWGRNQDCHFRTLFKRGEAESYIQLPVIEV